MCQGMFLLPDSTFVLMWAIGKCRQARPREILVGSSIPVFTKGGVIRLLFFVISSNGKKSA